MKNILIALGTIGLVTVSCGQKDDSKPSGPSVQQPNLGLVDAGDFKNTAKNGQEVGVKLKQASADTGSVQFAKPTTPSSSQHKSILSSAAVQSFLAGPSNQFPTPVTPGQSNQTQPSQDLKLAPTANSKCGDDLNFLNDTYTNTAKALKMAADQLTQAESRDLGEGVTRLPANDQFAVSYSIDLSKQKLQQQDQSGRMHDVDATLGGTALIGAGANDTMAILSTGVDATATGKDSTMTIKGGLVISTQSTQKLLKLGANADLSDTTKDGTARGNFDAKMNLVAGTSPSISFEVNGKSNLTSDGTDTVKIDQKDHTFAAKYSIERLANTDVSMIYTVRLDSKDQTAKVILTTDANGACVVKN